MASPIDVIIRAFWQGSRATQQARRELAGIDDGAKKGAAGLTSFATKATIAAAAIGVVAVSAREAYEALERGAGLELTTQRFDRLALSIGTTGDALRQELAPATAGIISNARQMALVTDLVALGLANTSDQAVRLARVATELNQDVGELSLALVNQTTRRFDQLGVSAVGFAERLEALKAQGLDTQEAFTEAFLQQAEEQIERVGGVSGTAAGDLLRLEAAASNLGDAFDRTIAVLGGASGAIDTIENIASILNTLSSAVEKFGKAVEGFDTAAEDSLFISLFQGLPQFASEAVVQGIERWDMALTGLSSTASILGDIIKGAVIDGLEEIEQLTGLEIVDNMAQAVAEAESFDRALVRANNTLTEIGEKLNAVALPRGGFERGGSAGGREGEAVRQQFGTIQERVELFQRFQSDLTAINEQAAQERAAIEEQYEARRTSIVESYGRERAEEEADFLRRRARQEADFQRSLADVRASADADQREARQDTNERLEKLERDHLRRIRDIIDNANLQLTEAASRLDAKAIANIQRQRDAALKKENESYGDQRHEIEKQLDEQLKAIQDNMQKRLDDMQAFHEEQLAREDEDRAIRLERLEEAHRRELQELESQYRERMQDLKTQIRAERQEITKRYTEAYNELTQSWEDRKELDAFWQGQILQQEADWWNSRLDLVGGDSGRGDSGSGGTTGGGGTGGGGSQLLTVDQLLQLAEALSIQQGYSQSFIDNLLDTLRTWTAEQIAAWIERAFDYDVPGYAMGTPYVPRTGLAMLHQGEAVLNQAEAAQYRQGGRQANVTLNIYPSPGMDESKFATHVRRELVAVLEQIP